MVLDRDSNPGSDPESCAKATRPPHPIHISEFIWTPPPPPINLLCKVQPTKWTKSCSESPFILIYVTKYSTCPYFCLPAALLSESLACTNLSIEINTFFDDQWQSQIKFHLQHESKHNSSNWARLILLPNLGRNFRPVRWKNSAGGIKVLPLCWKEFWWNFYN